MFSFSHFQENTEDEIPRSEDDMVQANEVNVDAPNTHRHTTSLFDTISDQRLLMNLIRRMTMGSTMAASIRRRKEKRTRGRILHHQLEGCLW